MITSTLSVMEQKPRWQNKNLCVLELTRMTHPYLLSHSYRYDTAGESRLEYSSEAERSAALLLFISMFQVTPRDAFGKALEGMFPAIEAHVAQAIEDVLTPFRAVGEDLLKFVVDKIAGADRHVSQSLTELLCLACNGVYEASRTFPMNLAEKILTSDDYKLLKLAHTQLLQEEGVEDITMDPGSFDTLVDIDMRQVRERAVDSDIKALEHYEPKIRQFITGSMLILEGVTTAWKAGEVGVTKSISEVAGKHIQSGALLLARSFDTASPLVEGVVNLGLCDVDGVAKLVSQFSDVDFEATTRIERVLSAVLPMAGLLSNGSDGGAVESVGLSAASGGGGEDSGGGGDEDASWEKDDEDAQIGYRDIFDTVDKRGLDGILFEEWITSMKIYGLYAHHFSESELLYRFAHSDAMVHSTPVGLMSYDQFESAVDRIEKFLTFAALLDIGFDPIALVFKFGAAITCLMMLFAFIFMGVAGFSASGSFGATVNSGLPVICGRVNSMLSDLGDPEELAAVYASTVFNGDYLFKRRRRSLGL